MLHKQLQGFQMGSTNPVTSCAPMSYQSPNLAMDGRSNESGHVCLLTVIPGLHPLNQRLTNCSPSQVITNFPLLPNKCCEETVDLNLFSNASNILKKVQVSLQAAQELYTKTTSQANNNVWYEKRKYRITASKFGKIFEKKESANT